LFLVCDGSAAWVFEVWEVFEVAVARVCVVRYVLCVTSAAGGGPHVAVSAYPPHHYRGVRLSCPVIQLLLELFFHFIMGKKDTVSLLTLNVNGLKGDKRRSAIFTYLALQTYDIVFLQETHICDAQTVAQFKREWHGRSFFTVLFSPLVLPPPTGALL